MAWTYAGTPSASDREWIRWRLGLTDTTDQLQTDAEIAAAVTLHGDKRLAAVAVARAVAARFARRVDSKMGKLSLTLSQKAKHYEALAAQLQREVARYVAPTVVAISVADKQAQEDTTDRVAPAFAVGMTDQTPQDANKLTSTG